MIKSIFKNKSFKITSFYLFGNIFDKGILFLTIPIFTRLMPQNDFGIVNTYLSVVSILTITVGLSLSSSIRHAYMDYKTDIKNYMSAIFQISSFSFLIIFIVSIIIVKIFYKEIDITIVVLALVHSYGLFIVSCMNILYMMRVDYIKKTLLMSLLNVFITVFSIILLLQVEDNEYLSRIIPYVLIYFTVGLFFYLKYVNIRNKKSVKNYYKYALKISVPLIFHGLSTTVLFSADRIMLTFYRSASETGMYSLIYSLCMITIVFKASLESLWIPWFNDKINKNLINDINSAVKKYIIIILTVMICLLLVSPEILHIMAPKEYWGGVNIIPVVIVASFFMFLYSISVNLEYYYKSTKMIAINTISVAILNIILNIIFIPKYGAIAAALTTLVSYLISFIVHYLTARKLDNRLFEYKIYIVPILMMGSSVIIFYNLSDNILTRWIVASGIFIWCIFRLTYASKLNLFLKNNN